MVIEGRLEGRGRGRRRIGMLDDFGVSFPVLKRWAEDRKEWRRRSFPVEPWTCLLRRTHIHTQLLVAWTNQSSKN